MGNDWLIEILNFLSNHELNDKRTLITRFILSDFAGCTGVFNRELLNAVIQYEPQYMLMHDTWILKVCLCLNGKVFVDTKPPYEATDSMEEIQLVWEEVYLRILNR